LAALLSEVTADSSALVAVLIALSAPVSDFAEDAAWVAAVFSRVVADVTLVAAVDTVRGVTAVAEVPRPAGRALVLAALVLAALLLPVPPAAVREPVLRAVPAERVVLAERAGPVELVPVLVVPVLVVLVVFVVPVARVVPAVFAAAGLAVPAVVAAAGFAARAGFAAPVALAAPAAEPPRAAPAIRTGAALAAVLLVGGTDLPPIWIR
jgi:hypothetical protein